MSFNWEEYRKELEADDLYLRALDEELKKQSESNEYYIDESLIYHGLTPRELLSDFEKNGIHGSFDYPGGYEQFKEDVLSGKFDYVDEMKYGDK